MGLAVVLPVITTVVAVLWRPLIGADAGAGTVAEVLPRSPVAMLMVLSLATTSLAYWFITVGVGVIGDVSTLLVRVPTFLVLLLVGIFLWPLLGARMLTNPPSETEALLLALSAGASLVMLLAYLCLVQVLRGRR